VVFELLLQCENFHLFKKNPLMNFTSPFSPLLFGDISPIKKKADPD